MDYGMMFMIIIGATLEKLTASKIWDMILLA